MCTQARQRAPEESGEEDVGKQARLRAASQAVRAAVSLAANSKAGNYVAASFRRRKCGSLKDGSRVVAGRQLMQSRAALQPVCAAVSLAGHTGNQRLHVKQCRGTADAACLAGGEGT